jgi:GNAT superfamily N-acetyltransferase
MAADPAADPAGAERLNPGLPSELLRRAEEAGLNASAPPQQLWHDGWLVRRSPGKAKRARCIQAVSDGHGPLDARLAACAALYADAGLPLVLRVTPFSAPAGLDATLAARGWSRIDDTVVMLRERLDDLTPEPPPPGLTVHAPDADAAAQTLGRLRGSPPGQVAAQAQRLQLSPVPYRALMWCAPGDGPVAFGHRAREAEVVGLYDIVVAPAWRGRGLARALCRQLLADAAAEGARWAYLQVESDNAPARAVYRRLGFVDGYGYHYRSPDPQTA